MNQSLRRVIVALLLAVLVYGVFVGLTGYQSIGFALSDFHWSAFVFALGLSSANYVLRFLKWEFYLHRLEIRGVPKVESFLVFLSGFVLTVTPGKIGEVFKSAVLQETHGVEVSRTAPIIIAERLTDVIAIIILIFVGSLGFSGGLPWALAGCAAVSIGLLFIIWPVPFRMLTEWMARRGGASGRIVPQMMTAYGSLRIVASPGALIVPTVLSLIGWGGEGIALYLLLEGFQQTVALPLALFFYATATLAGALVPVPGGLGVAETMIQSQLVQIGGVSAGAATASMLMIRFATLWWAVIVGFAALGLLKLRYPSLLGAKSPSDEIPNVPQE
jgi:uncharacterized protein (TIRG00374 family)